MTLYLVAKCKNPQCRQLVQIQESPLPEDNEFLEKDMAIGEAPES
jgi:hypothetical protein